MIMWRRDARGLRHLRLAGILLLVVAGCTRYPEVTSPESLHLLAAARTACSSQNLDRVARVRERLDELQRGGKLSSTEQASFVRILELAEKGDWEAAEMACFRYQKAQLRQ